MPEIDTSREPAQHDDGSVTVDDFGRLAQTPRRRPLFRRFLAAYLLLLAILLLVLLPPLLNVNRFKRRIVTSISASLGRPVHLDSVSLVLLPFPGFKLVNFVVAEDPAFGAEPVIYANNVQATLRFRSLWRRKVEFSKISLREPSINLVHTANGAWNVESILLQAARIPVAPTAQSEPGAEPRFPYIEATDARVNLKAGNEKLPFSLTEADFALWLPEPRQWRVRIEAKPSRTDSDASDTGTVSLEGSLGRADRFDAIPLDLVGEWKNVPLGEASRVVMGRDAGLRGDLRLNASAHGTIGSSLVKATLELNGARRSEFVPQHALDIRAECQATATNTFHAFHGIRCAWPPPPEASLLAVTGDLPNVRRPGSASFELGTPGLSATTLPDWLRVASPRIPTTLTATGTLTGTLNSVPNTVGGIDRAWSGQLQVKGASLAGADIGDSPIVLSDVAVSTGADDSAPAAMSGSGSGSGSRAGPRSGPGSGHSHRGRAVAPAPLLNTFVLAPESLALGGREPAILEGRFDHSGCSLHLSGNVLRSRLLALATALPQFGDGIAAALPPPSPGKEGPIHIDLTWVMPWGGDQTWTKTQAPAKRR